MAERSARSARAEAPSSHRRPSVGLSPRAQQTLFALPAFRGLAEADRREAARLVHEIAVEKGEIVYRAGDEADALYLVVSGAVDLVDGDHVVARIGPGEPFGESVLVAGERRLTTARIALDATLLVLPRESVALLLELHPSLQERVSTLLFRHAKHAVHLALGAPRRRPSEVVVIEGWTDAAERRAFVEQLAEALERELDLPAAIVTVTSHARAPRVRADRPDTVVSGDASRERIASELAARGAEAPIVLLTGDDAPVPDLAHFADVFLVRIDGHPPADRGGRPGSTVFVHDRRSGPGPSLSGSRRVGKECRARG